MADDIKEVIGAAVQAAENKKDLDHSKVRLDKLEEAVYKDHGPVILWAKNFMESYRKIVAAVVISGLITFIGMIIQLYSQLQKAK